MSFNRLKVKPYEERITKDHSTSYCTWTVLVKDNSVFRNYEEFVLRYPNFITCKL